MNTLSYDGARLTVYFHPIYPGIFQTRVMKATGLQMETSSVTNTQLSTSAFNMSSQQKIIKHDRNSQFKRRITSCHQKKELELKQTGTRNEFLKEI